MYCLVVSLRPGETEGMQNAPPITRPQVSEVTGILTVVSTDGEAEMPGMSWQLHLIRLKHKSCTVGTYLIPRRLSHRCMWKTCRFYLSIYNVLFFSDLVMCYTFT